MQHKILIIDDEDGLVDMITSRLQLEGFLVSSASDGTSGFQAACREQPDLIILDLMMPGINGLEVCHRLRSEKSTSLIPIIMLTAKKHEIDAVAGLETGADDYIGKPFSYRELLARIHALLRRVSYPSSHPQPQSPHHDTFVQEVSHASNELVAGPLCIDLAGRRVKCRGRELDPQPKQFDLLAYLVRNRGTVLTRDQLLNNVWGHDYVGDMRTVDVHVRWLREKLEEDPSHPQLIQTVRGIGYVFRRSDL